MQNESAGTVLVVGAGIGGLSTAIALRDRGFDVHVIERMPDLHSSIFGVGIIQPANALRALNAIGCLGPCLEHGFATAAWGRKLDQEGNLLGEMPGTPIEGYPPMNGITRPRLHKILTDRALGAGVTIQYDTSFTDLKSGDGSVTVTFGDGSQQEFDVVVGADGVRSSVRRFVLDHTVETTPMGQSAFRINHPRLPEMDRIILQEGESGMAGIVPIGPDLAYLFLNVPADPGWRLQPDELLPVLREKLACFGGIVGRVRDEFLTKDTDIVLRPEEYMIVPAPWHRGRIVLIGDAVHAITPHLGQGAAQAIEDGVVLADCLSTLGSLDSADDVEQGFLAYAGRRYERCKLIVETSAAIGRWEQDPSQPFDHVGVTQRVTEAMAAPL